MNIKCTLGFHTWNGCTCTACGKVRDEQHDWTKDCEKCSICGKIRADQHDWSKDCEKCSKCGKIRENHHDWSKDCEKCSKCGKTRENHHDWSKDCDKCSKCGKTRENHHDWSKDCNECSKCGEHRYNQHDWTKDCEKCSKCGKTIDNQHDWSKDCKKCSKCGKVGEHHNYSNDCEKCSICGKAREDPHDWSKDCEKCSKCGKIREDQHDWSKDCEKCSKCGKTKADQHDWSKDCEKCSKCGKTKENQHNWSKDCEKCTECGKIGDHHDWTIDCEKCFSCGKIRTDKHKWQDNECMICGEEIKDGIYIDERDGNQYKTIKIGNQTWFAENLRFNSNTGCWAPEFDSSNIQKYGFLYEYNTACLVAPKGWHLPSDKEWQELEIFLGMSYSDAQEVKWRGKGIGSILKSRNGWNVENNSITIGFDALPAGYIVIKESFMSSPFEDSAFWTSSEWDNGKALFRHLRIDSDQIFRFPNFKYCGLSVRCIKDLTLLEEQKIIEKQKKVKEKQKAKEIQEQLNRERKYINKIEELRKNNKDINWMDSKSGIFIDPRDNKKYKVIIIGEQIWFAENLRYKADLGCWVEKNSESGYLYNWETSCSIIPTGWHLPSKAEWEKLIDFLGGEELAHLKLRSSSGWVLDRNGTNEYNFNALPVGSRGSDNGPFTDIGAVTSFWTSTSVSKYTRFACQFYNHGGPIFRGPDETCGFSVRCIKD